ncbi:MAG: PorP/SprF family type IX secretion system membrane protein, partial [Bacteroidia bacterium]
AQHNLQVFTNYRQQWNAVTEMYRTINFSADLRLQKEQERGGFWAAGLSVFNDRAGEARAGTTSLALTGAYQVKLNASQILGLGIAAGMGQRSINARPLQWGSQYNGTQFDGSLASGETSNANNFIYPDLSAGLNWSLRKGEMYMTANNQFWINAGIGVFHINRPAYSFYGMNEKLNMRYSAHTDAVIGIPNTPLSVLPAVVVQLQGKQQEILAGGLLQYTIKQESRYTGFVSASSVAAGLFFRNRDALIVSTRMQFSTYMLGLSYDINTSSLRTATGGRGSLEFSFQFIIPGGKNNKTLF